MESWRGCWGSWWKRVKLVSVECLVLEKVFTITTNTIYNGGIFMKGYGMRKKYLIIMVTTAMVGVGLISGVVMADNDSVVDEINITVPVTCTLGGTGMDTHNATINNGQYNSAIGESTIKVFCNDSNGFSIYAIGYTDDTDGNNVLANATLGGTYDIETGTLTSGASSQWAMKLSTITSPVPTYPIIIAGSTDDTDKEQGDPDFTSFQEVPDDYTKVAYRKAGTDIGTGAEGATLKSTYQAYISPTQPAGTYTGQVKYTMVHPYNATAPVKPVACNPTGTTIGTNTSTDITCMQDISSTNKSSILTSMTAEQQYTLTDKRDNKTYTISKLADGNIWMTQNLDLDLDAGTTYTNLDTDLGWNGTSYSTAIWSPERSTYTTGTTTWGLYNSTTGNHDGFYHPESYDPGDLYWNGTLSNWNDWDAYYNSCTYNNTTWLYENCDESLNPISTYTTVSGTPTEQYHLGNFYNWSAAIASNDSSIYGVYDSGTDSYTNTETSQSICPAGWTLPIGGYFDSNAPDKSFQNLVEQYGWDNNSYTLSNDRKIWESPIYLGLSGGWYGMLEDVGGGAYAWSSVANDDGLAYVLSAGSGGNVGPDDDYDRNGGHVVRCVARW